MKKSSGILLFRFSGVDIEIFLVHPGGPYWMKKDLLSWSIPKGEFIDGELPLVAALREFEEETGIKISGEFIELTPVRQKGGKQIYCYACEGNIDAAKIVSNSFNMEWPPKSGKYGSFPEIDRGGWFSVNEARLKIIEAQSAFIDELIEKLKLHPIS